MRIMQSAARRGLVADASWNWTSFMLDAEVEMFGTDRIAKDHNNIRAELAEAKAAKELAEGERDEYKTALESIRETLAVEGISGVRWAYLTARAALSKDDALHFVLKVVADEGTTGGTNG